MSTINAEYVAPSPAAKSAAHFRHMLHDIHHHQRQPTDVYKDNEGAVKLSYNRMPPHMTKHFDVRHHYTRELVDACTIAVISNLTSDMLANGLTKARPQLKHTLSFKRRFGS
jgi:hypothetical protein